MYNLGTMANGEADRANSDIVSLKLAVKNAQTDILELKLLSQNPAVGIETPVTQDDIRVIQETLDVVEKKATTAQQSTAALTQSTAKIEQDVKTNNQEFLGLQGTTSDVQRSLQGLTKEVELLSVIAKQSVEVSESKKICGEVATYVGQMGRC